jgi:hypothetical protein
MPPASQLIATQVSTVEGLANAWLRVPKNVTTTYTIRYEGGEKKPPGVKQHGGPVSAYSPYIVGEAGPELFVPNTSGRIVPNNQLGNGGGGTIIIHNHSAGAAALTMAVVRSTQKRRLQRSMGG